MNATTRPLIAHVVHRLDVGGLENGVVNLVNRMPAASFRQAIVCLAGYSDTFRSRIRRDDVQVLSLDKRPGKDVAVYARMWRALRRLRPDVLHTRNLGTVDMQWVGAAAGVRARVHGEHGWEASDPLGRNPKSLRIRRACRPVIHRYVPMSRDLADWLRREVRVDATRIRQLYNGVDTDRFAPAPDAYEPSRQRVVPAGAPAGFFVADAVILGTVGRLDPVKNQATLVAALHELSARAPALAARLRLVVAGDGPLRDALATQVRESGLQQRVWLAGSRSDTPEILRACDVFVLPSINEGISNTILEAMATGLPVVAGRVGGNPEVVVDGQTGALYDAAKSGALAAALLPYVTDARRRRAHGQAGRERAVTCFGLDAMVRRYQELYEELLTPAPADGRRGSTARAQG